MDCATLRTRHNMDDTPDALRVGSCAARKRHILFNLELARVPLSCIEYIVVHELTHLAVQNHGPAFKFLMTQRLPQWPQLRKQLKDAHALA